MILPGGAFITLGLLIGLINFLKQKANKPEVHAACEVK